MLYTGGVSFFALLALFPAIAILIGFYKAVLSIGQVSEQAFALAELMPHAAQGIFREEIGRLANASARTVSAQSAFAVLVGAYAAHRGFKALLAGLNPSSLPEAGDKDRAPVPAGALLPEDLVVWSYDKADYTIRLDVQTGSFEQLLLGGGPDGPQTRGMSVQGMSVRGMSFRGMSLRGGDKD